LIKTRRSGLEPAPLGLSTEKVTKGVVQIVASAGQQATGMGQINQTMENLD
jgi:methyl-accepting chemotaxis protein